MGIVNQYVLAMYDVRGKQNYIFRGRKLKEIVGGSLVIRDIFKDYLYPAADKYAVKMGNGRTDKVIFNYKEESVENGSFSREGFERHLAEGYLGEVIYDGGGNFFVMYKDITTYREINKIFTKEVMEKTYSLTVLCSCIEGVDFDNYTTLWHGGHVSEEEGDREKLYRVNREREARINTQIPAQVLPFTQVDYANSLPLYEYNHSIGEKVTRESARKYEKFAENIDGRMMSDFFETEKVDMKVLDEIAREKGEDSWIAILYIDGNNMGAKVQDLFRKDRREGENIKISYESAVSRLREFSGQIQKDYVDDRIKSIDQALLNKYQNKGKGENYKRRLVIYAGDEINIILNAHDALDAVKAYFDGMKNDESACAGIAIFKSHAPYADAYHIAEQCCENAKQLMKKHKMKEACLVDFHYCQGAIGTDIDSIREWENEGIISKPWFVKYDLQSIGDMDKKDVITLQMVEELVGNLNTCSRTNIKGLLECAKNSEARLLAELNRMQVRRKNAEKLREIADVRDCDGKTRISERVLRNMIYDIVSVYDLWFGKEGESKNANE